MQMFAKTWACEMRMFYKNENALESTRKCVESWIKASELRDAKKENTFEQKRRKERWMERRKESCVPILCQAKAWMRCKRGEQCHPLPNQRL